jgi:uncharacterized protein YlzI (FlbEa/FlbD family)
MTKMIEVTSFDGKKWLINTDWIEMIEANDSGTTIYFAFYLPNSDEQDYIRTQESYDEIKKAIVFGNF